MTFDDGLLDDEVALARAETARAALDALARVGAAHGAGETMRLLDREYRARLNAYAQPGGGTAVWSGVNLCEAKAVTLNRNESGAAWVDYD